MAIKITCVQKSSKSFNDPNEAIIRLRGMDEKTGEAREFTVGEMVKFIENGGVAYAKDGLENIANLIIKKSKNGDKYIATMINGRETKTLISSKL